MVTSSKMANVFVKEGDSEAEDKRPNLFDVIEERNRSMNKVATLQFIWYNTDTLVVINRWMYKNGFPERHLRQR